MLETSVSIALWAVRVCCAWVTSSWFVGGGGGDAGSVDVVTMGVLLFGEEELSCCCVWSGPVVPVCVLPCCSDPDGLV